MDHETEVTTDAHGGKTRVLRPVEVVETQARARRVDLQVKDGGQGILQPAIAADLLAEDVGLPGVLANRDGALQLPWGWWRGLRPLRRIRDRDPRQGQPEQQRTHEADAQGWLHVPRRRSKKGAACHCQYDSPVRRLFASCVANSQPQIFHFELQTLAADAQEFCGLGDVAAGLLERLADELALDARGLGAHEILQRGIAG